LLESPPTNSGLKRKDVNATETEKYQIPVYSASKDENLIFGWTSLDSKWKKYENLLTWNKDGSANYVFYRKNIFVPYEKVKMLKLKEQFSGIILYEYLRVVIQESMKKEDFNFNRKCSMDRVLKLSIPIPFDERGNINIDKQKEIIERYEYIVESRTEIDNYKKQIEKLNVEISSITIKKVVMFNAIFDFPSIKGLTKQFIESNKGNIPVYGGRINEEPVGFIEDNLKNVKYFKNCLAWNREGSVGYVFWHKHKFTTNDHHRPILVKRKYENLLDLTYLQHTIQNVLMNEGFVWSKTASKEKVEKFHIEIPINSKGEFDLSAQQQIAEKYHKIEQIKKSISEELDKIAKIEIDYA